MNKKIVLYIAVTFIATVFITISITSVVLAEQSGDTPDSGVTSRIKQIYDSLVSLSYGSDSAGGWGDWGASWNRLRSAAEWTPDGDATVSDVMNGKTFSGSSRNVQTGTWSFLGDASASDVKSGQNFYSNSSTLQTGTLALVGNATSNDVMSGKSFYGNTFTLQNGTWSFLGNATASDVALGKTFYGNLSTLLTGTAQLAMDYSLQQYNAFDDYEGPGGNGEAVDDYTGDEAEWNNTAPNIWKDERTGLYWSANLGSYTNVFPNQDHSACPFFSSDPRGSYNGLTPACGNAINACGTLELDRDSLEAGGDVDVETDWYLPTQKEFLQAYIDGMFNQAGATRADAAAFVTAFQFWSSSEVSNFSDSAWSPTLHYGYSAINTKTAGHLVRCTARD